GGLCFPEGQNISPSDSQHRLRCFHAVLFHQSRPLRFFAGALARLRDYHRPVALENADKNCRRVAASTDSLHESTRSDLHDSADGDRPDLRNYLRALRVSEPHYRSTAVHDSCHGCHPERIRAYAYRSEIFPTNKRRDARVWSSIYSRFGHPFRGRCHRRQTTNLSINEQIDLFGQRARYFADHVAARRVRPEVAFLATTFRTGIRFPARS